MGIGGDFCKLLECMILSENYVYDLVKLLIRKRCKFNVVVKIVELFEWVIVDCVCFELVYIFEFLLVLEWCIGELEEWYVEI